MSEVILSQPDKIKLNMYDISEGMSHVNDVCETLKVHNEAIENLRRYISRAARDYGVDEKQLTQEIVARNEFLTKRANEYFENIMLNEEK